MTVPEDNNQQPPATILPSDPSPHKPVEQEGSFYPVTRQEPQRVIVKEREIIREVVTREKESPPIQNTNEGITQQLTALRDELSEDYKNRINKLVGGFGFSSNQFENLTAQRGLTAGSGNVQIINTAGQIPALSSTYLADLSGANLTNLNADKISAGTLAVARGGTGLSSFTAGDLIYASSTTSLAKLGIGSANQVLTSLGTLPQWSSSLSLPGTLNAANSAFQVNSSGFVLLPFGTSTTPSLAFTGDSDTGIFGKDNNILAFGTGGTERLRIDGSGRVGIGMTSPIVALHVKGISGSNTVIRVDGATNDGAKIIFASPDSPNTYPWDIALTSQATSGTLGGRLTFSANSTPRFQITDDATEIRTNKVLLNNNGNEVIWELFTGNAPATPGSGVVNINPSHFYHGTIYKDSAGTQLKQYWDESTTPSAGATLSASRTHYFVRYYDGVTERSGFFIQPPKASDATQISEFELRQSNWLITSPAGKYLEIKPGTTLLLNTSNVGIGTTGPESKVQISGGGLCVGSDANCNTDNNTEGVVYSSATSMTVYDVAENYPTKDATLTFAEVVSLDTQNGVFVKRADEQSRNLLLGVISEKPAVLLGGFNGAQFKEERQAAVALSGRVPVKVSQEGGDITIGDSLTISSQPGIAKKTTTAGRIIGYALEPFPSPTATSTIQVFVNVGYQGNDLSLSANDNQLQISNEPLIDKDGKQLALTLEGTVVIKRLVVKDLEVARGGTLTLPAGQGEMVGDVTIPEGLTYAIVENSLAQPESRIFLTLNGTPPKGITYGVTNRKQGQFTIQLTEGAPYPLEFTYWILNTYDAGAAVTTGQATSTGQ